MTDKEVSLRELQEERSELVKLLEAPGYKRLMLLAEAQIKSRQDTLCITPLKQMDGVLEQEFSKGEVHGIMLFTKIVDIELEQLNQEIETKLKEQGNVDSSQTE